MATPKKTEAPPYEVVEKAPEDDLTKQVQALLSSGLPVKIAQLDRLQEDRDRVAAPDLDRRMRSFASSIGDAVLLLREWVCHFVPEASAETAEMELQHQRQALSKLDFIEEELRTYAKLMESYGPSRERQSKKTELYPEVDAFKDNLRELDERQGRKLWKMVAAARYWCSFMREYFTAEFENIKKPIL